MQGGAAARALQKMPLGDQVQVCTGVMEDLDQCDNVCLIAPHAAITEAGRASSETAGSDGHDDRTLSVCSGELRIGAVLQQQLHDPDIIGRAGQQKWRCTAAAADMTWCPVI